MAAPTPTARQTPSGWKMPEGFKCLVTFASQPAIQLWERDVKPPGVDGGDKIDTTTQHNSTWHTFAPRQLKTLTDGSAKCAYDPDVKPTIISLVNSPDVMTVTYPDHTTEAFYGYLQKFEPDELKIGEFPLASVTFVPTNYDHVNKVEAGPAYAPASGT